MAGRFAEQLQAEPEPDLLDICHTAAIGRSHLEHRLAVLGADARSSVRRWPGSWPGLTFGTLMALCMRSAWLNWWPPSRVNRSYPCAVEPNLVTAGEAFGLQDPCDDGYGSGRMR